MGGEGEPAGIRRTHRASSLLSVPTFDLLSSYLLESAVIYCLLVVLAQFSKVGMRKVFISLIIFLGLLHFLLPPDVSLNKDSCSCFYRLLLN